MSLNADDFGCVPDGRCLEGVSIQAGSAHLTVAAGSVRATDVGKHIAIPGAVDLNVPIATLVDDKVVAETSMTAGSTSLVAVLTPQEGFKPVHRGQRIAVTGAGPAGRTLVTDVLDVVGPTRLELADPAAENVMATGATLNRPDVVALADYARATALNVTVNLTDRVLTDATMTIGGTGLSSPTAGFSAVDVDKQVTIRAAGRLVTTIVAVVSDNLVMLAAPAQRTVSDGRADVWRNDSRPGFQDLLAAIGSLDVQAADIRFGPGVYDFTRIPKAPGTLPAAIRLDRLNNVTVRGAGPGLTVLRLMPDQDLHALNTHVVMARDCTRLTLRDLTVHGAYLTMRSVTDQTHGILINEGCQDVVLDRVEVFQSAGDGIRLLGEPGNKIRRVWMNGCRLIQNKRTGIAFQRSVEQVWIRDCYIETTPPSTDSCIDFEPSESSAPTDVLIDGTHMAHGTAAQAVSISGVGLMDPTRRVRFTNNTVLGGRIGGVHAQDVTVTGNTIVAGDSGDVMLFRGRYDGLRIENNTMTAPAGQGGGIRLTPLDGFGSSRVRITDNDIEAAGTGILLIDPGDHVEVRGNRILGQGGAIGISVVLKRPPEGTVPALEVHSDIRISANTITDFGDAGIEVSTANTIRRYDGFEISGNEIDVDTAGAGSLVGIRLPAPGHGSDLWFTRAVVSGNRIADAIQVKIERHIATVRFLAIAGNPADRTVLQGDGDPNEINVVAPPGSLYVRMEGVRPAVFLKLSGTEGTGWTEMAQAG